jgi:hypothetical protein
VSIWVHRSLAETLQTLGRTNKLYNGLRERFIRSTPSINQMPNVQGLYMEIALPPFNADLKIWYDKRAG